MKALRMLRPIRSAACTLFMVLMACLGGAQAGTCSSHPHQVVVYFGNGINTSPESAERSMLLLRRNLGTTYNDKALRYDLAYNATDGRWMISSKLPSRLVSSGPAIWRTG